MLPPLWGLPPIGSAALHQLQREFERVQERFDQAFRTLLHLEAGAAGHTPSDPIYREGRIRVLRYRPVAPTLAAIPVLIIPSVLSRAQLFDLLPGRSMVEYLVGRGLDVYLLDWGVARREDRHVPLDEYIAGYLARAVAAVAAHAGQPAISLLGYSVGGTFAAIFTSLNPTAIRNLALLAAPVNFHDDGLLSQWTRKERFNVDMVVDTFASMPVELVQASFRMLTPLNQIAQRIALAETFGDTDAVQDMLALQTWLNDFVPFLGEAYRTFMKDCYQENLLIQGRMVIDRRRVDLRAITAPLLVITASQDAITFPQSAAALTGIVQSSDRTHIELPGGHVEVVAGRVASSQLWPQVADWLLARSTP